MIDRPLRLAVIGDVHGLWDATDTAYFNRAGYDCMAFVGDLPRLTGGLAVARQLAELHVPAIWIPGNHDAVGLLQLLAERFHLPVACTLTALPHPWRLRRMAAAMAPVRRVGFQRIELSQGISLIVGRPCSMGGDRFYFRHTLSRTHGVKRLAQSAEQLYRLVDGSAATVVFLAHNGPAGLGTRPDDPYGCDFDPERGDFGDADLAEAVDYARRLGKRVPLVASGHMHHALVDGGHRRWWAVLSDTLFVNAARVPRIETTEAGARRHHVAVELTPTSVQLEEVWVDDSGRDERTAIALGP